jgi:hypothetical protein
VGPEFTSKAAALQGDSAEIAPTPNVKLWVLVVVVVVACCRFPGTAGPNPLFESIWTFENNFESTSKEPFSEILTRQLGSRNGTISARGNKRHRLVGLRKGNARHRLNYVATRLPPAGPHTDMLCRNRRRHNNCSNLRQRRREDTASDPSS